MSGDSKRAGRRPEAARTSWDPVAAWYDGWVGERGSRYHRQLAIPSALDLLELRPGEHVLDVGAGQGVLAPHIVERGAFYTGLDASPHLIRLARRRHGDHARFLVGDARRLPTLRGMERGRYDAGVFLLSIQDMDPLDDVIGSVSWALRLDARIVILMTHPAFRVPRHSGWGFDPSRKLFYRRIDSYLTPMNVPLKTIAGSRPTRSFHRPLSAYVDALASDGFMIDAMREVPDTVGVPLHRSERPVGNPDIPLFLVLRARRPRQGHLASPAAGPPVSGG